MIEACDIVGVNFYPMGAAGWFTFDAFDESRRFLIDGFVRMRRLAEYEAHLRILLDQLKKAGKPLILTETGFPSAVGYRREEERLIIPESDHPLFGEAMHEFVDIIRRTDEEYTHPILGLFFYEWRDNLHHDKIWNIESSPIHIAFGLCDRYGVPKFDLKKIIGLLSES